MKKIFFFLFLTSLGVYAQKQAKLNDLAEEFTHKSLPSFKEVLSIPNDAFNSDWIEKNVAWP